jgi:hypothetical protein
MDLALPEAIHIGTELRSEQRLVPYDWMSHNVVDFALIASQGEQQRRQ